MTLTQNERVDNSVPFIFTLPYCTALLVTLYDSTKVTLHLVKCKE